MSNERLDARRRRAWLLAETAVERRYGMRDARLRFLREGGFRDLFRVSSPSRGEFVLRMYNVLPVSEEELRSDPALLTGAGLRSLNVMRSQLCWLSALRDEGVLVPEPVPATDGSLVSHVAVEEVAVSWRGVLVHRVVGKWRRPDFGRHCVLLRWMPGNTKSDDLNAEDLRRIGAYLARLHGHTERYSVPEDTMYPRWDWQWPFGESASLWSKGRGFYSESEMEVFRDTARRVQESLQSLGENRDVFGLIHRDPQPKNIVFHENEVGAVDFDLCGLGHYLLDVTAVLVALKKDYHGKGCGPMQAAFLESYQKERPLPEANREYFKTFTAMLTAASVNERLRSLDETIASERGRRFLSTSVRRLEDFDAAMRPLVAPLI